MVKKNQQKKTPKLKLAPPLYIPFDVAAEARLLSEDLCSRWERYGPGFQKAWLGISREHRAATIDNSTVGGMDRHYCPDWDPDGMAENPNVVIGMIKHRTTAKLSEQALNKSDNGPSDLEVTKPKLKQLELMEFPRTKAYLALCEGEQYGVAYLAADQQTAAAALLPPGQERLCLHQGAGEVAIVRQCLILEALGAILLNIWEQDPREQPGPGKPDNPFGPSYRLMEALGVLEPVVDESLFGIASNNKELVDNLRDSLGAEVGVLKEKVAFWFLSQPSQVLDKSRMKPLPIGDKHVSICLFDAVQDLAKHQAFWAYIVAVLPEVQDLGDQDGPGRNVILQEIANVCHIGFQRAQNVLKRSLQSRLSIRGEDKNVLFRRTCGEYDNDGNPLVTLTVALDELNDVEPPIHPKLQQIIRLSQPETTAEAAFEWLRELQNLCKHNNEGLELLVIEAETLTDMVKLLRFIGRLTDEVSLPPVNGKKRLKGLFVSKCQRVDRDLRALRDKLDLALFTVPLTRLGKPEMAAGALKKMNDFCKQKTGASVADNYDKAVRDSLSQLKIRFEQAQAKQQKDTAPAPVGSGVFINKMSVKHDEDERQGRKEKVKTRPTEGPEDAPPPAPPPSPPPPPAPEPEKIKVSANTAAVFDVMFDRTQSRRPIAFTDLESAMAELGFGVNSQVGVGSATTFTPPEGSGRLPITVHRPHGNTNKIEGRVVLRFAKRFRRHFGWDAETFEVA